MKNKLIVRIAEGLGNQLFMYAHSYALSKKINYNFYIDDESAYFKKKDVREYELDNLNISAQKISNNDKFNSYSLNFKRTVLKKIDFFLPKKNFLIEQRNSFKQTKYYEYDTSQLSNKIYVEGFFESEQYFKQYKDELRNEFKLKDSTSYKNNKYYNDILHNDKIVSICVRQNRYSERIGNRDDKLSIIRSDKFTQDTIEYIYRAISICEKKIDNPIFYIWSNDFKDLQEYFNDDKFIFVENNYNKSITDFYLLNKCKNFIVGPTSFHWWPAWLNYEENNIIIRPKNLNPSNNLDFWPESWISV
tara:strand:+ start:1530 stop:2441 length:912 start_codon:yes stop_codon:yes gene_type:complete